MFEQAAKAALRIIFIDEMTPVAPPAWRAGLGGGHDEREQTLNQMLPRWTASKAPRYHRYRRKLTVRTFLDPALLRPAVLTVRWW